MKPFITFPHRGPPPPVPKFYEPEPGDPYVMRLSLFPCEFRKYTYTQTACCCKQRITCERDNKTITTQVCATCQKELYERQS